MSKDDPYIEIIHSDDRNGVLAIASSYNVDAGPLAIPECLGLGKMGTNCGGGHDYTIMSYADQVDQYRIWLDEQIKAGNVDVLTALDDIFNKAIRSGIVLTTRCSPAPWITHAHVVKDAIMELAGDVHT